MKRNDHLPAPDWWQTQQLLKALMPNGVRLSVGTHPSPDPVHYVLDGWHSFEAARVTLREFGAKADAYVFVRGDNGLNVFVRFTENREEAVRFHKALPFNMMKYEDR